MDTANTLESDKSSLDSENELDPNILTPEEKKKTPLLMKVYGILCLLDGAIYYSGSNSFYWTSNMGFI